MEIKDQFKETRLFINRTVIAVIAVFIFLFVVLVYRMFSLQVFRHEEFNLKSAENRIKVVPIPPRRGLIFDRKENIIADNVPSFQLKIIPEDVKDIDETINGLKEIIQFDEEELSELVDAAKRAKRSRFKRHRDFPIKFKLEENELAQFSVNRHKFPGVDIKAHIGRRYLLNDLASHVIGYVGRIDENELRRLNPSEYIGTTHIGKTGIEKYYEDLLHGSVGMETIEVNATGRRIRSLEKESPSPGKNIVLTIDLELQRAAEKALGDYAGSIVAVDPNNGEVLAMASQPGYDLNLFPNGISSKNYKALRADKHRPLFNRITNGQYPPGSTVKPPIGLAGLYTKTISYEEELFCPGFYKLPNVSHKYRDWKRWGHGKTDLKKAIAESCDVYFYDLAYNMGIDQMSSFLARFGFGQKTEIDLPGEKRGILPSREWKRETWKNPKLRRIYNLNSGSWFHGETLITGIGQGFFLVTPLQLAHMTSIIANKGKPVKLHLLKEIIDPATDSRSTPKHIPPTDSIEDVPKKMWDMIHTSMIEVVNGKRGSARKISKDAKFLIAGKTGTAQVYGIKQDEKAKDYDEIAEELRDHALFISFAPADDPKIVVAVIVENGGGGSSVAAPIAREVLDAYLNPMFVNEDEEQEVE